MWRLSRGFGESLNFLSSLFDPNDADKQCLVKVLDKFGMNDDCRKSLRIQSLLSNYLINIELIFRFTFQFFIKNDFFADRSIEKSSVELGSLSRALKKFHTPARVFDEAFDKDTRNSLAHGSFWLDNEEWYMTSDPHFRRVKCLEWEEFVNTFKKANCGAIAFVDALQKLIDEGFFRS